MIEFGSGVIGSLLFAASGDGLFSLWRIELLHPALMHFSIALTLVGTAFWLVGGAQKRFPRLGAFEFVGGVTLVLAAISAWVAVQTGFWADAVVGRELYDPRPLKDHEILGVAFAWVITATAVLDLARRFRRMPFLWQRAAWWGVAVLSLIACGLVLFTAHLGAGLVYQQGAGVKMPR